MSGPLDGQVALFIAPLRPHDAPRDWLTRGMDRLFGPFFRWFNGWFGRRSEGYGRGVTRIVQRKAIAMGIFGVILATIGIDGQSALARFTFDQVELFGGLGLIPVLIGLVAISEVMRQINQGGAKPLSAGWRDMMITKPELKRTWNPAWRGSLIGFFIGILPGVDSETVENGLPEAVLGMIAVAAIAFAFALGAVIYSVAPASHWQPERCPPRCCSYSPSA